MSQSPASIAVVITTIQPPTLGVVAIARRVGVSIQSLVVIGDQKGPSSFNCNGAIFYSYAEQLNMEFALAQVLVANSYTRKMLGYLVAFETGAAWIRETDDDNAPYDSFFDPVPGVVETRVPDCESGWINIYSYFTDRFIWPRGFPLGQVRVAATSVSQPSRADAAAVPLIFQALADGDPDVDAIYRLSAPDVSEVHFVQARPLKISGDVWTPFNSQATTWPRELLPIMYLPTTCSFRMTDIWRSFVALRLLQGLGGALVVTPPTVYQDRNAHDLMRDFHDEIEGYVGYERLVETLAATPVLGGAENVLTDLRRLYEALIEAGFLQDGELVVLDAWIADMRSLGFGLAT